MRKPPKTKTRITCACVAPIDLRIAMSLPFSMTFMISEPTMLKEATSTMSVRITNIAIFSRRIAPKSAWFISLQSRTQ